MPIFFCVALAKLHNGAADETWTRKDFTPRVFKTLVYAYSTTAACLAHNPQKASNVRLIRTSLHIQRLMPPMRV